MSLCLYRSTWSVRGSCSVLAPLSLDAEPTCQCGLSLEELHLTICCSSSSVPAQHHNIPFCCSWSSVHCHILQGIHVFLFSFSQSLKSDEEAESAKEPQNELFEARGKATASWLCSLPLTSALKFKELGHWSVSQPCVISWEACRVGGVPRGPLLQR